LSNFGKVQHPPTLYICKKTVMRPYQQILIYYFSGTGNSENVALWVSSIASKYEIATTIFNIANIDRLNIEVPPSDALVVFVSPVHGFNYPPVMLNFIARFPAGRSRVVLMNTRAGMLIGKFITPGWSGIALLLSALMLKIKGYLIKGMVPVDMPSNWISVHPGLNNRTVKYLHEKNRERVSKHAEKFIAGKNDFIGLRELVQDVAIAPVAVLYYLIGRFVFSKTYYASASCNDCGICMKKCPVKAIRLKDDRPYWTFRCESCMRCMSNCPKKAIETAHGFVIAFILVNSLFLLPLFYHFCDPIIPAIHRALPEFVAESALFLFFLALAYRMIHYGLRYRFIERMIVYTSLTKYKWWGRRYKALKNN